MIVLPKWYLWLFTLVSIDMAVDTILARFFDIGDTQDSISIGWWVMFVLLIFSNHLKVAPLPGAGHMHATVLNRR